MYAGARLCEDCKGSLAWNLPSRLVWQTSEPQGALLLCLPSAEIPSVYGCPTFLYAFWGTEHKPSRLHGAALSTELAPQAPLSIIETIFIPE